MMKGDREETQRNPDYKTNKIIIVFNCLTEGTPSMVYFWTFKVKKRKSTESSAMVESYKAVTVSTQT